MNWAHSAAPLIVAACERLQQVGPGGVHATQFFEFVKSIAAAATDGNTVRLAPVLIQPVAADDVAKAVGRIAVGAPVNGVVEIAGPEQFRLDELGEIHFQEWLGQPVLQQR